MKKSRFTEGQIMAILEQHEAGVPVTDLSREHDISTALIYQWRSKYGGMDASMMTSEGTCKLVIPLSELTIARLGRV